MKENSEVLTRQIESVGVVQGRSEPEITLVTARDGNLSGIICPPNCLPGCPPSCPPNIIRPPCFPAVGLPRPKPPGPPNWG